MDHEGHRAVGAAGDDVLDEVILAVVELRGVHGDDRGSIVGLGGLDHGAEEVGLGDVEGADGEVLLLSHSEHLIHVDEHCVLLLF